MSVTLTNGTTTVTVSEIVSAALTRPLRRVSVDVLNDDNYQIVAGTAGKLRGQIVYLCDSLVDALSLDTLYRDSATITLVTGTGAALNGLTHIAVDNLELSAEKAIPGWPSKWLLRAEVREI